MAYATPVVAATTTGITVTGGFPVPTSATMDGVSLSTNQRVLLAGQGTLGTPQPQTNGVWLFKGANTAMARPATGDEYATSNTLDLATLIPVSGGNTFGGTCWGIDPAGVIVVQTTGHTLSRRLAGVLAGGRTGGGGRACLRRCT
jgi:multidrug efflux pump subunit AcrA (membrane-fusion protein)